MAPSRALTRCATSVQHRPSPRLLSAACRITAWAQPPFRLTIVQPLALHPAPLRHSPAIPVRLYSHSSASPEPPDYLNEKELHIFNKLKLELQPMKLEVQDISGGCGSMYALEIESPKFKGLSIVRQHKLVNAVLADEIKGWHGVQLRTKAV